jgi:uncharacterized protein YdhG (YjbR/CyaY superfamily)
MNLQRTGQKHKTIDEYIADSPEHVRNTLQEIREVIKKSAPDAKEVINYGIPTFKLSGNLVHFAALKNHIGFYPNPSAVRAFQNELSTYKISKGSVKFPLDKPIPFDLTEKMVLFRANEVLETNDSIKRDH